MEDIDLGLASNVIDEANDLYQRIREALISTNAAIVKDGAPLFMKASTVSDQRLVETSHIVTYSFTMMRVGLDVNSCMFALSKMVSSVLEQPAKQSSLYQQYLLDYHSLERAFIGKDGVLISDIVAEWIAENALYKVRRGMGFSKIVEVISYVLRIVFPLMHRNYDSHEGRIIN